MTQMIKRRQIYTERQGLVKALVFLTLICAALGFSRAAAQSAEHDVKVGIPSFFGIRIVNDANVPRGSPAVNFDYASDVAAYTEAYEGSGYIGASNVTDFADVQVSVRTGFGLPLWYVEVTASPLEYRGAAQGAGFALEDIQVVRGAVSGLNQSAVAWGRISGAWALSTDPQEVALSIFGTRGWQTLGFSGQDYRVKVDGDEDPGEYSTTVTYAIFYP